MLKRKPYRDQLQELYNIEINDDNYRIAFNRLVSDVYNRKIPAVETIPEQMIIEWRSFVLEYPGDDHEEVIQNTYEDMRDIIDPFLASQNLKKFHFHSKLIEIIKELDKELEEKKKRIRLK